MKTTTRVTLLLGALTLLASTAQSQYFGRNSVQYKRFQFKILKTQHFDVYYYDSEAEAAAQAGGMAEYVSLGNVDPNTTMWMRDAVRRGELPKFRDLENPRYFPYRWGQSFLAYLGGTYGDDIIGALLRSAGRSGNVQLALEQMTHRPPDSLIADWHRALTDAAQPVAVATGITLPTDRAQRMQARLTPATTSGARALVSPGKEQHYNLAPALSPDGSRMVYISDAGLFSFDIYLANAEDGHTIRKLVPSTRDPHLESLQFINSAGSRDADRE